MSEYYIGLTVDRTFRKEEWIGWKSYKSKSASDRLEHMKKINPVKHPKEGIKRKDCLKPNKRNYI